MTVTHHESIKYKIKADGILYDEFILEPKYEGLGFGPELEFFTVDKDTLKPKDCLDTLAGLPNFEVNVKPELAAEQIEITIPPTTNLNEMYEHLVAITGDTNNLLDEVDAVLLPISLYDTEEFTITPNPRNEILVNNLGPDFRKHAPMVASDQINIGASNETGAFAIYNTLRSVLPTLMGLSAASPIKNRVMTGRVCHRLDAYDAAITKFGHLTGIPDEMHSLEEYAQAVEDLPVLQHPNMFYKYMRPMPHRGVAAEIRAFDKQPTIEEYMGLVALTKAIVLAPEHFREDTTDPDKVENDFLLARYHGTPSHPKAMEMVDLAKTILPRDEIDFLTVLERSSRQQNPAKRMQVMESGKGISYLYNEMIDDLYRETFRIHGPGF